MTVQIRSPASIDDLLGLELGLRGDALAHRGREDDGLERRSGLSSCLGGEVELALAEVPAPEHRLDRSGLRVDCDERRRRPVRIREHLLDRLASELLELEVDGRRHLEAAAEDTAGAVFLDELVLDVVDEVLRRPLCAGEVDVLRVGERRRVGPPEVAPRDLPLVEHGREDVPSALLRARRVGDGVVPARIGGDPGEESSLREIELLGALLEVRTRCLLDPVRAVPEVDRVQVRGEDPILAPALLELPRERSFTNLAGESSARSGCTRS